MKQIAPLGRGLEVDSVLVFLPHMTSFALQCLMLADAIGSIKSSHALILGTVKLRIILSPAW
jgi:hypothetical protein